MLLRELLLLREGSELDIPTLCSRFISESRGLPIYRGVSAQYTEPTLVTPRKNRQPTSTKRDIHFAMDNWFSEHFGAKPRSEGLFVTSDIDIAKSYGNTCFVLPVNSYKYFWANHGGYPVLDSFDISREILDLMQGEKIAAQEATDKIMVNVEWHDDKLAEAIKSEAELAIIADSVIMVPFGDKLSWRGVEDLYQLTINP